jgi:hypothetical protein
LAVFMIVKISEAPEDAPGRRRGPVADCSEELPTEIRTLQQQLSNQSRSHRASDDVARRGS